MASEAQTFLSMQKISRRHHNLGKLTFLHKLSLFHVEMQPGLSLTLSTKISKNIHTNLSRQVYTILSVVFRPISSGFEGDKFLPKTKLHRTTSNSCNMIGR